MFFMSKLRQRSLGRVTKGTNGSSEVETTSHHEESDNEQTPKVKGMKIRLHALECLSKQVADALAHQGKRCEGMENQLRRVEEFNNDTLGEFCGSAEMLSDTATLVTGMEDRLNGYKEELKSILETLTDLQDMVTLLK